MLNLDPKLLDQEKVRKEKRKQLLRTYTLPIALLLLIALFFLSCAIYNLSFYISYSNHNYPLANNMTETRFMLNFLESYIADYNQGTTYLNSGEYQKAEESFKKSLELNPPSDKMCAIYTNLAISLEKQGDNALNASQYDDAIKYYNQAEYTAYSHGCAGKNDTSGKDIKADLARNRAQAKRRSAINERNNTADDSDSSFEPIKQKELTDEDAKKNSENNRVPSADVRGLYYERDQLYNKSINSCDSTEGDICW